MYGTILPANSDLIFAVTALSAHIVAFLEHILALAETWYCYFSHYEPSDKLIWKCRLLLWCELVPTVGFSVHIGFSFLVKWQLRWDRRSSSASPMSQRTSCSNTSVPMAIYLRHALMAIYLHANTRLIFLCSGYNCCLWLTVSREGYLGSFFFFLIYFITLPCLRSAILDADYHYFMSIKWA